MAGRLNMLYRDRHAHARTARLVEVDGQDVVAQKAVIIERQATDRKRQAMITEMLAADRRRQKQFIEKMAPKRATRSNIAPETTNTTSVTNAQLQAMINQGITAALAARDADRNTNDDDSHILGAGFRRTERTARECTYTDFLKCQPLNFKGMEGDAGLSQWFERMKSVFYISNCTVENQVKFATCTLHSVALTWWNTHVKTVGHDAAYGMLWKTLMKMMTDKYCPQNEIKKLEMEIWDLKVKESDKIEKYVGGLPDMIHGSVVASKPKTMQDAVEIITELMDKKICTFAEYQT
ncbi:reverse transcriptase domain-containing protein [Tanacetum coccineum]